MKKFLLVLLVLAVGVSCIGYYMWNKPHANVSDAEPEFKVGSQELIKAFETNEQEANAKYVGKLIEVRGKIGQVDQTEDGSVNILLASENPMSTVMCQLDAVEKQEHGTLSVGQAITLKGLCSGYTADVVLDRCHIVK